VNNQDTTAVLTPISGQAEETETNSQPAPALSLDGKPKTSATDKTAPDKKRTGRLADDKRIFQ
jgi:ribose-phosphate pyrophosphokinase